MLHVKNPIRRLTAEESDQRRAEMDHAERMRKAGPESDAELFRRFFGAKPRETSQRRHVATIFKNEDGTLTGYFIGRNGEKVRVQLSLGLYDQASDSKTLIVKALFGSEQEQELYRTGSAKNTWAGVWKWPDGFVEGITFQYFPRKSRGGSEQIGIVRSRKLT